jgi:hypothetical protein
MIPINKQGLRPVMHVIDFLKDLTNVLIFLGNYVRWFDSAKPYIRDSPTVTPGTMP